MAAPLSHIPSNSEYDTLRAMLTILERDFPAEYASLATEDARVIGWVTEISSGTGRSDDQIRDDIAQYIMTPAGIMRVYGVSAADADKLILGANEGGLDFGSLPLVPTAGVTPPEEDLDLAGIGENPEEGDEDLTILTGEDVRWFFDTGTGKWYVSYGLPDSDRSLIFEASPDQMDALFGEGMRPIDYTNKSFNAILQDNATFAGNISEMAGTGSFEGHVERITALALDEGKLPEWANNDPAVMDLIFIAQSENKSDEWLLQQISELESFKARFPNIKAFQAEGNLTLGEAVSGFLEMEAGVRSALTAAGFDSEAVTPEIIGLLLAGGHSLDIVNQTVSGFKRMQDFAPALEAFNDILQSRGLDLITSLDDMLKFVSGQASLDVYDIWEASSLQEAAVSAGLGDLFSAEDAMASALSGNHTLQTATAAMQQAAQLLLRLRHEVDTGKFGLELEELIDISLGQTPRSGRSTAEINDSINRAVAAAQASLKQRAKSFTSFDRGAPQAASLELARQEQ